MEFYKIKTVQTLFMSTTSLACHTKCKTLAVFNPLTPRSDKHETSPYDINTLSNRQVVRFDKRISQRMLS